MAAGIVSPECSPHHAHGDDQGTETRQRVARNQDTDEQASASPDGGATSPDFLDAVAAQRVKCIAHTNQPTYDQAHAMHQRSAAMPKVGPRRENVVVRMSAEGIAMLDQIATEQDTNRSEVVRRLIKEAINARIAKGWRPN